ncbi:hypothetical protein [Halobacillus andaensis]|uniref:hypothetical protein n=1 Tax=Halobacillus andaensis TaxID=1176239 RepID=UPI003D75A497
MVITYIPPKIKASTREIAIQKGKYIVGYMAHYFHEDVQTLKEYPVNLEVQSEETNNTYIIQQDIETKNKWTIFQAGKQIGEIAANRTKKFKLEASIINKEVIKVEAGFKGTGRINKNGVTAVKGLFQHKIKIDTIEELREIDSALLTSIVHVFWCSHTAK